jgi:hypothetical protein
MKLRGKHVIAEDCWCKPSRTSYAEPKSIYPGLKEHR